MQLTFSPYGKCLAWSSWREGTVYLSELANGRVRRRFAGHLGCVNSFAFSADGKMLISGSNDTTALVWDLTGRLAMGKKYGAELSAQELESHWKVLAADDAEAAFRTMQALAADPVRSIPYLRTRLRPVAPVDEKRVRKWIADLDSNQFAVRKKATAELEKLGAASLYAMRKALDEKPALEIRRRLELLIEKLRRERTADFRCAASYLAFPRSARTRRHTGSERNFDNARKRSTGVVADVGVERRFATIGPAAHRKA